MASTLRVLSRFNKAELREISPEEERLANYEGREVSLGMDTSVDSRALKLSTTYAGTYCAEESRLATYLKQPQPTAAATKTVGLVPRTTSKLAVLSKFADVTSAEEDRLRTYMA
eukprot:m.358063 g.358063  ORF g.358063 m.358063 type:complete len:114 (+) comp18029_c0_seq1:437-778(+)